MERKQARRRGSQKPTLIVTARVPVDIYARLMARVESSEQSISTYVRLLIEADVAEEAQAA